MQSGCQYIDGVSKLSVVSAMALIDLVVLVPPAAQGHQPKVLPAQHLVMPPPRFVRPCAEMAGHQQRIEETGVISRQGPVG